MRKQDYAKLFTLRPDGRYQGYWHDLDRFGKPSGRRHTICDKDPERLYLRIQEKEKPVQHTLRSVADQWETMHRDEVKARTWANYKPHLDDIVAIYGDQDITQLSVADVAQDLQAAKGKSYSRTVVNTRRSIWRGIFDYAVSQRILPYNPAAAAKLPRGMKTGKRNAPPDDVIAEILAGANDMQFGFVPFFLLCTGLRRNEALRRRVSDLDTQSWELQIPEAKTAAGVRTVPIIQPLREPLQQWIAAHPGPWLFPHRDYYAGRKSKDGYMTDSNWETAWANYCKARGWTDEDDKPTITAHNLRHGTATLLYEAGVDVYTAQRILGHANVKTTLEIYTDLRKQHEKKNVSKFDRRITAMIAKGKKAR